MSKLHMTLNGRKVETDVLPGQRALDILRDVFGLTGTKEGCGQGECGSCTILVDGKAVHACLMLAEQMEGHDILTIEGLEKDGELDRIQQAFFDAGAVQCGFCTPGMIMSVKGLLLKNPNPSDDEIKTALEGNLCRCTGYASIERAVHLVIEGK